MLKSKGEKSCYIEVKSSTLSRIPNISEFPDSVTSRGSKHLSLLANLKNDGFRAIQIYLIQRNDTNCFKIAKDIDHQYFKTFQIAKKSGVEILILQSLLSYDGIELSKKRLEELYILKLFVVIHWKDLIAFKIIYIAGFKIEFN